MDKRGAHYVLRVGGSHLTPPIPANFQPQDSCHMPFFTKVPRSPLSCNLLHGGSRPVYLRVGILTRFTVIWLLGRVGPLTMHACYSIGRAGLRGREAGTCQRSIYDIWPYARGWLIIVSKFKNGKKQAQIRVLFGERENPPKCNPSSGASSYFLLQLAGIIKSDIAV